MRLPLIECNFAIRDCGSFHGAISPPQDWRRVHALRERHGFVAVGANTWNIDRPRLLVQPEKLGRDPVQQSVPVVIARHTPLKPPLQSEVRPIVVASEKPQWPCNFVCARDLSEGLKGLAAMGVESLFVEGGPTLFLSLVGCQELERFTVYVDSTSIDQSLRAAAFALPFLTSLTDARAFAGGVLLEFRPARALARVA